MFRVLFSALILLTGSTVATAAPPGTSTVVQFSEAFAIAQALVPGGVLVTGRVEAKPVGKVYGFYFFKGAKLYEIEINPHGDCVKNTSSDVQNPAQPNTVVSPDVVALLGQNTGKAKLPVGRLLEIYADSKKDAAISSMTYVKQGDQLVVKIGNQLFDPVTGQVITPPK
jgi:hypothetical protein